MDSKNEYAFPSAGETGFEDGESAKPTQGMTLRDYFAAKAMQAYIAATLGENAPGDDDIAEYAYDSADAMLRYR